jgi:hypothetical protein
MNELINKLPMDIVLRIIPYTYNVQNKKLLDDIVNYNEIRTTLLELYYQYWTIIMQEPYQDEYKYWLINDIIAYANKYNATMYGYVDNFYNIFKRDIRFQRRTNEEIDKFVSELGRKDVSQQINVFLGLLTASERKDLIIAFPMLINN